MNHLAFAQRLRALMDEMQITQADLAKLAEVSQPTVHRWLAGQPPPTLRADLLARKLGLRYRWLLYGEEPMRLESVGVTPLEQLKRALKAAGLSDLDLAKRIGYQIGVVQSVLAGRSGASEQMIEAICKAVPSLSKHDLMAGSDSPIFISESGSEGTYGSKPNVTLPKGSKGRLVPVLAMAQAGKYQIGHTDEGYSYMGQLAIDVDDHDAFAVEIEGDSMIPLIHAGDRVIICPSWQAQSGDIVLIKTMGGDVFCKMLQRQTAKTIHLVSINTMHPPIDLPREEIAWLYPVAQLTKNLKKK